MLALLSWIYRAVTDVRNRLYDRSMLRAQEVGAPVYSIGNITAGGTGKTPLVLRVAAAVSQQGEKVCILTRGYGRANPKQRVLVADGERVLADPVAGGDEPYELALKLKGKAVIIADADRVSAARWAKERFDISLFILDDGFQHRRLARDLDIVCIDATQPFANARQLPAGRLREAKENLSRADAIVITRSDAAADLESLRSEISRYAPKASIFAARSEISCVRTLEQFRSDLIPDNTQLAGKKVFAFSGLGNPENFLTTLRLAGATLVGSRSFSDHHRYTEEDIRDVESIALANGAEALITTAKDAVKLLSIDFKLPCLVVEIDLVIDEEAKFQSLF
jgi:tetraacyldisaccharide 4'-kinase